MTVLTNQASPVRNRLSDSRPGTAADVLRIIHDLGDIPPERVWMDPCPGTATEADVEMAAVDGKSVVELVDGTLVEKAMGFEEARLASTLGQFVENYLDDNNLGFSVGADGTIKLDFGLVRIPDLSFIAWDRVPDRKMPRQKIPAIAPNLAVEVLSASNTKAEMARKRREYFRAGTQLVWEVDPVGRLVRVYTRPDVFTVVTEDGTLDGGEALPGFTLTLKQWFERAYRSGE